ncbi:MFS transporter [Lacticaseibacillus songhuajiangensis]|jgi:EmrB/QacA subfamily drug resistance transporter|uniref:MFS transporter n=1 Tax=Lacticaseibacillus songhuajiangensis TaxID=1296539 RepID=UPI000F7905F2|nr:MFS transporter [Lacticaseibacillus songhuajiangensis]
MNKSKFGMVLPIILISYFMILLDNSIVFTSTVKIAADLHMDAQSLAWVTNAYALSFGGLLMIGGRAGDIYGRRRVFIAGLLIFTLGSLLVGMSQSGAMIIAMRALQGVGSAILAPTTLALLMDSYQGATRTRAIAYYGATAGIGASFGLVIGGLIASYFSWRDGFLLNVPVGLIMLALTLKFVPAKAGQGGRLDWLGAISSAIGFAGLIYSINGTAYQLLAAVVALVALVTFIWAEHRAAAPIMPLRLFADRQRSSAYLARFFYLGAMISYFFLVPQAMQNVYGYTPLLAALGFLPETIPQFLSATVLARLNDRFSNNQLMLSGVIITLVGLVMGAVVGIHGGFFWALAVPMVIIGIGQGLSLSPLTVAGVANTDPEIAGSASGVVNTVHQIGSSFGLSVIVALTSRWVNPAVSYNHAAYLMAGFMVLALLATLNGVRRGRTA